MYLLQNFQANEKTKLEIVTCLTKHGANVRYADDAPLFQACCFCSQETIKLLLELGCLPNKDLHVLCGRKGFAALVRHLLTFYPNLDINSSDGAGRSPLLIATSIVEDKTVWALINDFHANVYKIDSKRVSAIEYILIEAINGFSDKNAMMQIANIFVYFNTMINQQDIYNATQHIECLTIALLFFKYSAEYTFVQGLVYNSSELRYHERRLNEKSHPFLTFFKSQRGHVPRLKEFCRALIRKEIGFGIVHKVSELGLPKPLQDYILIPELHAKMQRYYRE